MEDDHTELEHPSEVAEILRDTILLRNSYSEDAGRLEQVQAASRDMSIFGETGLSDQQDAAASMANSAVLALNARKIVEGVDHFLRLEDEHQVRNMVLHVLGIQSPSNSKEASAEYVAACNIVHNLPQYFSKKTLKVLVG